MQAESYGSFCRKTAHNVYMCGLKSIEKGINDIMVSLAVTDVKEKKRAKL